MTATSSAMSKSSGRLPAQRSHVEDRKLAGATHMVSAVERAIERIIWTACPFLCERALRYWISVAHSQRVRRLRLKIQPENVQHTHAIKGWRQVTMLESVTISRAIDDAVSMRNASP